MFWSRLAVQGDTLSSILIEIFSRESVSHDVRIHKCFHTQHDEFYEPYEVPNKSFDFQYNASKTRKLHSYTTFLSSLSCRKTPLIRYIRISSDAWEEEGSSVSPMYYNGLGMSAALNQYAHRCWHPKAMINVVHKPLYVLQSKDSCRCSSLSDSR